MANSRSGENVAATDNVVVLTPKRSSWTNPFPDANLPGAIDPMIESAGRAAIYAAFAWHTSGRRLEIDTLSATGELTTKLVDWAPNVSTCPTYERGSTLLQARQDHGLPPVLLPAGGLPRLDADLTSGHALDQARAWDLIALTNIFDGRVYRLSKFEARSWYQEAVRKRMQELGHMKFDPYEFIVCHGRAHHPAEWM